MRGSASSSSYPSSLIELPDSPKQPKRRWLRRILVLGFLLCLGIIGLVAVSLTHLDLIARWAIHRVFPGVTAEMDSLRIDYPSTLIVRDLELKSASDGATLLRMDDGTAVFQLAGLWNAHIDELELNRPNLVVSPRLADALAIAPSRTGSTKKSGKPFAWSIGSIRLNAGTIRIQDFGKKLPTIKMRVSAALNDFGVGGEFGQLEHDVRLTEISASTAAGEPVISVDEVAVKFTTQGLFADGHVKSIAIGSGDLEIAPEFFELSNGPAGTGTTSALKWTVGALDLVKLAVRIPDAPGSIGAVNFDLSAHLRDLGAPASGKGDSTQEVTISGIRVESDKTADPPLLTADFATARFSIAGLAQHRIDEFFLKNPAADVAMNTGVEDAESGARPTTASSFTPPDWTVGQVKSDYGTLTIRGLRDGAATAKAKFTFDATNLGLTGEAGEISHRVTLWDIQLSRDTPAPILSLDLARIEFRPNELISNHHIDTVTVEGGRLRIGRDLQSLLPSPDESPEASTPSPASEDDGWTIGTLRVADVRTRIEDDRPGLTELRFTLNSELTDISTLGLSAKLLDEVQTVEFADIILRSPLDQSTKILSLRSVFVRFSLRDIADRHLREIVILRPSIYLNQDLFVYMERATATDETQAEEVATDEPQWSVERLEVKFGKLVLGSGATSDVGLPLEFETVAENIELDNLASLQVQGALTVPRQSYDFDDYQIAIKDVEGDIRFSYPPEKGEQNLVQKLSIAGVRWRQFKADEAWVAATFDVNGINGQFGGNAYDGYLNGGFSFFFSREAPWIGWVSGTAVDTEAFTEVISPQNFSMTGPLDFDVQIDAFRKDIDRLRGSFTVTEPGSLKIGKLDDLIARIPDSWISMKQDTTRIALETLRDFEYTDATGKFWFVQSQGILNLDLSGPNGSRNFEIVLHDGQETENPWQQGRLGKN